MAACRGVVGRRCAGRIAARRLRPGRKQRAADRKMPEARGEHQGGFLVGAEKIGRCARVQRSLHAVQMAARRAREQGMAEFID